MAFDPHFDKVSLLLHMDGANGSTTFTDSSSAPKTITAVGNAKISTAQSKWVGASGYFDGNGAALSVANSAALDFGTGDFTIECWLYIAGNSAPDQNGYRTAAIVSPWDSDAFSGYVLTIAGDSDTTGTGINLDSWEPANQTTATFYRAAATITQGAWHHIAATVQAGVRRIFLDGVQLAATQSNRGSGYAGFETLGRPLCVAGTFYSGYQRRINGYIDDLRITKGVARYTANFTPPTEPFPDSAPPTVASAAATTPLQAAQALAFSPPTGKATAPTPLSAAQVTAYAMVSGYAASPTPLGQPATRADADTAALGTLGQNTAFGDPDVVLVNRVTESIQLAQFIPPLTALQGMAPGSVTAQASSLSSPAFGTPSVQFATSHEATSLESGAAFGTPGLRSIHAAESLELVQFGDVGAPAFAAHAASIQDGTQFGQPLAFTLHALPDWYAGLRFGAVAVQGTGVFPVLDGIQLGEFGLPDFGARRLQALPLHVVPQFGPITISRGAMTC